MLTFNDNKIELPKIVIIKMQDKIRVRRMPNPEPLNFSYDDKTRNKMV